MPGASKAGTIDPQGKNRVYVNEALEEVGVGSAAAAFVYKRGDLERLRARRHELGLDKGDDALRVQAESRVAEAAKAERRAASVNDELAALRAAVAELQAREKGGSDTAPKGGASDAAPGKAKA